MATTLTGTSGNDSLDVFRTNEGLTSPLHESYIVSLGDGDDFLSVDFVWGEFTTAQTRLTADFLVDLGDGNDRFYLDDTHASATLTLGAGQDRVELGQRYLFRYDDVGSKTVVINDFEAGNAGDVLDLGSMLVITDWDREGNPFATGFLRVLQQGADAVVAVDADGLDNWDNLLEVIRLVNVDASSLTAFNFAGFDPHRGAPAGIEQTGSGPGVTLFGGAGDDTLAGSYGNDLIQGGFGADSLHGNDGNDDIEGGYGHDLVSGDYGNDLLQDLRGGNDTLVGGFGNDHIVIRHETNLGVEESITVLAGSDADVVDFSSVLFSSLDASLGSGLDHITFHSYARSGATVSLGEGNDVVEFPVELDAQLPVAVTITDFSSGEQDYVDMLALTRFYAVSQGFFDDGAPDFNPFAVGVVRWQQSGADLKLLFGKGSYANLPLVVFKDTTLADLEDASFGTDIHALPPAPEPVTHQGTAGADTLTGSAGRNVMEGLAGNDNLLGLGGNDVLRGGAGNDTLDGGDGNDEIEDIAGDTGTIVGGTGDDTISVAFASFSLTGSINAGDGADSLHIERSQGLPKYTADMGAGNDHVLIDAMANNVMLTLGTGQDTLELPAFFFEFNSSVLAITDFDAGADGDVLDFAGYLTRNMPSFYSESKDPFEMGYLQLRQVGQNVELWRDEWAVHEGGPHESLVLRFLNTDIDDFIAANFGGYDPHAVANTATLVTTTTVFGSADEDASMNATPADGIGRAHYIYLSQDAEFTNHGELHTWANQFGGGLKGLVVEQSGAGSSFTNAIDGHFLVQNYVTQSAVPGVTYGVLGSHGDITFLNEGQFDVMAESGIAYGLVTGFDPFEQHDAVNTGNFTVNSGEYAEGVELGFTGSFLNQGQLDVHGEISAVGITTAQYHAQSIVNEGTIIVETADWSPYASVGILLPEIEAPDAGAYHHWNSGTIIADYAYYVYEVNYWLGGYTDILHNSGDIFGSVALGRGDDIVENTGSMTGRTFLGQGDDTYDGIDGFHEGSVEGEFGNDTILGGAADENLFGDSGADWIEGGAGIDYIDGGSGNDTLDGGLDFDILSYIDSLVPVEIDLEAGLAWTLQDMDEFFGFEQVVGSRVADTIGGTEVQDWLLGFLGNDVVDGRAGPDVLVGGKGADTITGGGGADRFLFDIGDGHDEVTDFGVSDSLEVYGYDGFQAVTQAGDDVLVTLSATDSMLVRNSNVGLVTSHLSFFATPLDLGVPGLEFEPLRVETDLVISSSVDFALGDTNPRVSFVALPASTALFLFENAGLWNAGTLSIATTDDEFLTRGVAIDPNPEAEVQTQILVNQVDGSIVVTAEASDAMGIDGVYEVWNEGAIEVESLSGNATGIGHLSPQGSVAVNSGTILVTAAGAAGGVMQDDSSSIGVSAFSNSGTVNVSGGLASTGYFVRLSSFEPEDHPTCVNTGTVEVTDGTSQFDSVGLGINLAAAAAVWNSGSIAADFAIRVTPAISGFFGDDPYGLSVYNTGALTGLVYLSTWDDVLLNTGLIEGAVLLGGGDDFFDGRGGTLSGTLDGYDGDDTLLGGLGPDTIDGGFGADVISGGVGGDVLTGGAGRDIFRFTAGDGHDAITDFETGTNSDYVLFTGYAGYQSLTQSGDDVLITLSANDSMLLRATSLASLGPGMLQFGMPGVGASVIPGAPLSPGAPPEPTRDGSAHGPIVGSFANDSLPGTSGADRIDGLAGDDTLAGHGGADTLSGGQGLDISVFTGLEGNYNIAFSSSTLAWTVSGAATATLAEVERLQFADHNVALDIDGNAGDIARLIGAVFGPGLLQSEALVGAGLDYLDGGGSLAQLTQIALDYWMGSNVSNTQYVATVYANLFGAPPDAATSSLLVGLLDGGWLTKVQMTQLAMVDPHNEVNIDLVGLAEHGLAYEPV